MMYRVVLSKTAAHFFETAQVSLQKRMDRCFDQLKVEPRYHPQIRPLRGKFAGYYRYRVGDYRIVYRIEEPKRDVIIALIAHRREIYK